jgi:hypothetical protein
MDLVVAPADLQTVEWQIRDDRCSKLRTRSSFSGEEYAFGDVPDEFASAINGGEARDI